MRAWAFATLLFACNARVAPPAPCNGATTIPLFNASGATAFVPWGLPTSIGLWLTTAPDACAERNLVNHGTVPAGAWLEIVMDNAAPDCRHGCTKSSCTGTFKVGQTRALLHTSGDAQTTVVATSGFVSLDACETTINVETYGYYCEGPGAVRAEVDLTFSDGTHLVGNVASPICRQSNDCPAQQ